MRARCGGPETIRHCRSWGSESADRRAPGWGVIVFFQDLIGLFQFCYLWKFLWFERDSADGAVCRAAIKMITVGRPECRVSMNLAKHKGAHTSRGRGVDG